MNNFKVGDKVETPYGIGTVDSQGGGQFINDVFYPLYKITIGLKKDYIYRFENELQPYKSGHDKLLELGWEKLKFSDVIQYEKFDDVIQYEKFNEKSRRTMIIRIPKDSKGYFVNVINMVIDLELSKILTQYLEELEKENEQNNL